MHFILEMLVEVKLTSFFFQFEAMHFRLGPSDDKEPVNSSPPFIDSRRGESMKYINEIGIIEKA